MNRPADGTWSAYYGNAETYPCGHPRTAENTQRVGICNGVRCKQCRRRRIARESARRCSGQGPAA